MDAANLGWCRWSSEGNLKLNLTELATIWAKVEVYVSYIHTYATEVWMPPPTWELNGAAEVLKAYNNMFVSLA